MNAMMPKGFSRRSVLTGAGALVVSVAISSDLLAQEGGAPAGTPPVAPTAPKPVKLPGSLDTARMLDAWIRVDASGKVTVVTGKAELGQGVHTALRQVAAEELRLDPAKIDLIGPDTDVTPNEGYTAGSQSIINSGVAIRHAAAQVREILIGLAATKFEAEAGSLKVENATITAPDGRSVGFGELVANDFLHVEAQPTSKLTAPKDAKIIGQSMPRVDIPGKVTGGQSFLQDMRMPGMLHARLVRPPSYGAKLVSLDAERVEKMPEVVKVFRSGNFLAVLARKEFPCIQAMRVLAASAKWEETAKLPSYEEIYPQLKTSPIDIVPIVDKSNPGPAAKRLSASYRRAYQMHAAIGPSCGFAVYDGAKLKVWTHNQGVFPLRQAIAQLVKLPENQVQCIHIDGSGCYGHNGSDDASADAAFIAYNMPGTPIRLQWMREDEHKWEPYGAAMTSDISATLDDTGNITDWNYDVWSTNHGTRPGGARALIAGWTKADPTPMPAIRAPNPHESDGNRNSTPPYKLSSLRVMHHFVKTMPLRVSAMRTLGAYFNVFCVETFMDDLALTAGVDPVEFRLRNLPDPRARDVVKLAAEKFGWSSAPLPAGRGRGFAYARYKNSQTYVAVAVELSIDRDLGDIQLHRIISACDSGQAINPDGIKNQIEGGLIQAASWTLYEQVQHNGRRITSKDWSTYPIMRFSGVPEVVEVHLIDRPDRPFLGAGEASTGPIGAAIGNAVAHATGVRLRELPLTPDRIRAAMGA